MSDAAEPYPEAVERTELARRAGGFNGTRRTRRAVAVLVAAAALAGVTAGCSDQDGNVYLHFTNSTDGPIEVVLLNPTTGSEYVMEPEIKAGTTSISRSDVYPGDPCSDRGVLIARNEAGTDIARRTGKICKGDTWVIREEIRASPSST